MSDTNTRAVVWLAAIALTGSSAVACSGKSPTASAAAGEMTDGAARAAGDDSGPSASDDGSTGASSGSAGSSGSASGGATSSGSSGGSSSGASSGSGDAGGPAPSGDAGPDVCPSASHVCGLKVVRGSSSSPGHITNGSGNVVQLHGVNIGGTEYMCTQGTDVFYAFTPDQGTMDTLKSYNVNAVRVPLNEQCWLGVNGLPTITGGAAKYRQTITDYVHLITQNGMAAILDLHVASPGTMKGTNFEIQMADNDHSTMFWSQIGAAFANDSATIFDLYNEPNGNLTWSCWAGGCTLTTNCVAGQCGSVSYQVAGMKTLLQAVRGAGAQNVVMMAGLGFSSDFSSWVASVPSDPNIVASWHMYDDIIGCPSCPTPAQTQSQASVDKVISAGYPVIMSEVGISAATSPSSASKTWLSGVLNLLVSQGQGFTAYEWGTPGDDPALLNTASSDGSKVTLTAYGTAYTGDIAGL
jgi:hypothetical protein